MRNVNNLQQDEESSPFYTAPAPQGLDSMQMEVPAPKSHPIASLVNLIFKILALVTYLFASFVFVTAPFVVPFIIRFVLFIN